MKNCLGSVLLLLSLVTGFSIEAKNGLQVEVSKKTMGRNDSRSNDYYYTQHIDRTMALHVIAKNVSMKDFPEGTVEYSLLVKKAGYSTTPVYELYEGTEKLPALKVAEQTDVVIGSAQINGWREIGEQHKDKLDYKIVIKHEGKETITVSTNPSFDAMAKRAHKKD